MNGSDLKALRAKHNISQQALSEATGIPKGTIGRIEANSEEIKKVETLEMIQKYFNFESNTIIPRQEAKPISLADPYGEHRTGDKIYELPDGQKVMEVKIVPAKGQAGYLRGFPDPEYYDDLPTITISVNGNHNGTYLAFEVIGDSMTPSRIEDMHDAILEGWHVVGRELPRHHWQSKLHTHSHSYWIIVHKTEGILIKNIKEHDIDQGTITIHSLNTNYRDEILNLDDIEQIFSGIKRVVNDR